jgi:very-short-patch-repair endonuclease
MEECCSQALYDWLRTNAPDAVVRLAHACGTMRTYCSESNECDGKVSPDFNESILEVIATAVNAMGQLGVELEVVSR